MASAEALDARYPSASKVGVLVTLAKLHRGTAAGWSTLGQRTSENQAPLLHFGRPVLLSSHGYVFLHFVIVDVGV